MQTNIETTKTTTLILNEQEVEWLRGLMQNPIGGMSPQDEPDLDRNMRRVFWDALGGDGAP